MRAEGIRGPETTPTVGTSLNIPNCVKLETEKDRQDMQLFVESIIEAARKNALEQLAGYVDKTNLAMKELVDSLKGAGK